MFTVQGGLFSGTPDAPVTIANTKTHGVKFLPTRDIPGSFHELYGHVMFFKCCLSPLF